MQYNKPYRAYLYLVNYLQHCYKLITVNVTIYASLSADKSGPIIQQK